MKVLPLTALRHSPEAGFPSVYFFSSFIDM